MSYHVGPGPVATFASTVDQFIVNPALAQVVTFNSTIGSRGITIGGNTQVILPQVGNYLFNISAIAANAGSANTQQVSLWFRKNGSDVTNSNSYLSVAKGVPTLIAVLLDLECTTVGDYYEVWWSGESTDVKLDAVPAVTGSSTFPPNQPLSPSIILTVSYVG
jgi:hypothetical protein